MFARVPCPNMAQEGRSVFCAPLLLIGLRRHFVQFVHVSAVDGLRTFGRSFGPIDLAGSRRGDPELPGEFGLGDRRE